MSSESDTFRARVTAVHKNRWEIDPGGSAVLGARMDGAPSEVPVVGDWVTAQTHGSLCRIIGLEPRRGLLTRKRPGDVAHDAVVEQPIAANVDLALLTMAVDDDFSLRRLERYLTLAWDSGATPIVILTKSDLAPSAHLSDLMTSVDTVAFGVRCIATSTSTGVGLDELRRALEPGMVAVLLGSSGVGKSSLVNALAGTDRQAVTDVRDFDGKGRHTTTSRQLVPLPWGAYIVDTPGLRELQLWADEEALASSFPDIAELADDCRFRDCTHGSEPGCAVLSAVADGSLQEERLENWRRLHRELTYLARRVNPAAAQAERQKWKSIARARRTLNKQRPN